jgi:arylsulfatase A-like enzyme
MITRSRFGFFPFGMALAALSVSAQEYPNVLLILSDDAGYADFGMQGSDLMKTPNIDALAAGGVRFTQGYASSSVCAPSRPGLLSGRYQSRFGSGNNLPMNSVLGLPPSETTIAEFLKPAGYRSYALGKWHLGKTSGHRPTDQGFDHFYGFLGGSRSFFETKGSVLDHHQILEDETPVAEEDWYLTDRFADKAVEYLSNHRKNHADQPFFMYLAFNAVHSPMQADEKSLAEVAGLGIEDETRRILAAMTVSMDRNIGKVMAALEANGFTKNTMVIFLNDNGGPTYDNASLNTPLRGGKSSFFKGGIRVPFMVSWPGRIPVGREIDVPVISLDLYPTIAGVAGLKVPESLHLDGLDLMPLMTGRTSTLPRDELFWRIHGSKGDAALRKGDWKVYRMAQYDKLFLFNLAEDPYEKTDLSKSHPEKLQELLARLHQWEEQMEEPRFWWSDAFFQKYKTAQTPEPR